MKIYMKEGNDKEWSQPVYEQVLREMTKRVSSGDLKTKKDLRVFKEAWLDGFYFGIERFSEVRNQ